MELKGSNNWSDLDLKDSDSSRTSREAPSQPAPEALPERKTPLFNLGVIYNRQAEPTMPQPIFQERDRSAPEVGRGVSLGSAELAGAAVVVPNQAEQALQQASPPEVLAEDDDDEDEEQQQDDRPKPKQTAPPAKPIVRPVPIIARSETITPAPVVADAEIQAPQPVLAPEAAYQQTYPSFDQVAAESSNPFVAIPENRVADGYQPPDGAQPIAAQRQPDVAPPAAYGGGIVPPQPPERPVPGYPNNYPGPERWSEPAQLPQQSYNAYRPQPNLADYVTRRTFENEQDSLRRKMAARMLMVAAVTWYLARRPVKPLREQVAQLQETTTDQNEQIARLTSEQQTAQARIAEQNRQIEQFTRPQAATPLHSEQLPLAYRPQQSAEANAVLPFAEQPKIIGETGEEIVLQPGQRLVREGVYSEVVDGHNRVVHNAMTHGKEYQLDLSRERIPTPFGAQDARFTSGGAGGTSQPMAGMSGAPMLPSVQASSDHALPMNAVGQTPNQEAQHLLAAPRRNPAIVAVTSPWLWLGVGILLIAFFLAATI